MIQQSQLSVFSVFLFLASVSADGNSCKKFHEIYDNGTDMCTTMWGQAFAVVADDAPYGYTMGFFDASNPNTVVSNKLNITDINGKTLADYINATTGQPQCKLQYYHYGEAVDMHLGEYTECYGYHESACCKSTTVKSFDQINVNYGEEYHVDRCGPMSDECKRFFMYEACLYECDPNAGLFRRYSDAQVAADQFQNATNTWEMYKMPIRRGFCDNWFAACYNDMFCADDSGDFFTCANLYVAPPSSTETALKNEIEWNKDLTILTIILSLFGLSAIGFAAYLVYRERAGKAMFSPLLDEEDSVIGTRGGQERKVDIDSHGL